MSKEITLTRRRVLGVLITIGLASAAIGVGTFAAFSDTEQSNNNSIEAGTLDLTVDGQNEPVQLLNVSDAVPGAQESNTTTLRNDGSVDGTLNMTLASYESNENDVLDPEEEAGDNTTSVGELHNVTYLNVSVGGTQEYNQTVNNLDSGDTIASGIELDSQTETDVTIEYYIPESTGNTIMSDNLSADFDFTLSS